MQTTRLAYCALALLFTLDSPQILAAHDQQCQGAWAQPKAPSSCTGDHWTTQSPEGVCNLKQTCQKIKKTDPLTGNSPASSTYQKQSVSFPLNDVSKLNNCDGILKITPC